MSGGGLGRLEFVAFHAAAPVADLTDRRRRDLGLLRQWCLSGHAIVAGGLNATLDHSVLRDNVSGCSDAASTPLTSMWSISQEATIARSSLASSCPTEHTRDVC